ncbi:hypothetical protein KFK09_019245 [Dendrobium nobile]|uniref:Uncharacterized protein n=1 Tax=Dendrobium nobile TaxID=94219 RepID=A0A8T3AY15_DENNO|nr:hypothetical protein KFK09_019245 [Dendrobium nobile]
MEDSRVLGYGSGDNSGNRQQPGRRIYDPYKDLQIPYRAIYDLPTMPEFLFQEESLAQRRSWGENLTYFTGIGYLSGWRRLCRSLQGPPICRAGGNRKAPHQPRPQFFRSGRPEIWQ